MFKMSNKFTINNVIQKVRNFIRSSKKLLYEMFDFPNKMMSDLKFPGSRKTNTIIN